LPRLGFGFQGFDLLTEVLWERAQWFPFWVESVELIQNSPSLLLLLQLLLATAVLLLPLVHRSALQLLPLHLQRPHILLSQVFLPLLAPGRLLSRAVLSVRGWWFLEGVLELLASASPSLDYLGVVLDYLVGLWVVADVAEELDSLLLRFTSRQLLVCLLGRGLNHKVLLYLLGDLRFLGSC